MKRVIKTTSRLLLQLETMGMLFSFQLLPESEIVVPTWQILFAGISLIYFFNCKRALILFFFVQLYIYWNLFDFDEPTPLCCFFVFVCCNGMTLVCMFIFQTHQSVCYIGCFCVLQWHDGTCVCFIVVCVYVNFVIIFHKFFTK